MSIFDGVINRVWQDLVAKALSYAGTAIAGSGIATADQTQMLLGAGAAIAGIVWNVWLNWSKPAVVVVKTNVTQRPEPFRGSPTKVPGDKRRK